MKDLIFRADAVKAFYSNSDTYGYWSGTAQDAEELLNKLPAVTLSGYEIEHLMAIASVMREKGITASMAVDIFANAQALWATFVEEQKKAIEKVLNGGKNEV